MHDVLVTRILICKHVLSNKTEKMVYIRVNLYELCFFLKYTRKVTGYSEIPNSLVFMPFVILILSTLVL